MKNKIFVTVSVILYFLFALINMFATYNRSFGAFNVIISILFIVFWCVMIVLTSESRGVMIYSISIWSITFIASLIALISAATQANVGFLMVPSAFLVSPLVGIGRIIPSTIAVFSILLAVSGLFIGGSTYSLLKRAK